MNKTKLFVVVGFLGSGKTTFLRNLAPQLKNHKVAVVINDFGDENTDINILDNQYENIKDVTGGSIFCSCKTDRFIDVVVELSKSSYDYIFIEGSGLANPDNINKILDIIDLQTNGSLDFSGVIGIVDATSIHKTITTLNAVKNQIIQADIILLNKTDLAGKQQVEEAHQLIREYNENSFIFTSVFAEIAVQEIFSIKRTNNKRNGFKNIDLNIQKEIRHIENLSPHNLEIICSELNSVMDRIKGVLNINDISHYFEYINDELLMTQISPKVNNYIVFLSTSKEDINNRINQQINNMRT